MSKQAERILSVIHRESRHMTAEEVFLACREAGEKVSVASVYRCLSALVAEGRLRRFSVTGEPDRYDKTLTPHEHVVCCRCGRVTDVHADDVQSLLERTFGITLCSYDLSMRAICSDCRD